MKLNTLKRLYTHIKELKTEINNKDKECLILFVVLSMIHKIYPRSYLKDNLATTSTTNLTSSFKGFAFFKA